MEIVLQILAYCVAIFVGGYIHQRGYQQGIKENQKLITSLEEELNHKNALLESKKLQEEIENLW